MASAARQMGMACTESEELMSLVRRLAAGDETAVEPAKAAAEETDGETAAWALQRMVKAGCLIRHDLGPVPGWRITHVWKAMTNPRTYEMTPVCYDQHIELLIGAGLVERHADRCGPTALGKEMVKRGDSLWDIERAIETITAVLATTPPKAP